MSRLTKRMLASVGAVALVAELVSMTGAASAAPLVGDDEVPVQLVEALPSTGAESSGALTSAGYAGTGVTENGIAPEATVVSDGAFEGQPRDGESVIGADGRVQVVGTATQQYPARAIGQIEFTDFDGGQFICTGWLIDSNSILTSGHCAFNPHPNGNHIIQSAQFFPGRSNCDINFQNCVDPFGGCSVNSAFSRAGWRVNGRAKDDWAVLGLNCNIGNTVGYLGYFALDGVNKLDGKTGRVEGYPGDKPPGTHWKMSGTMASRSNADMLHYAIDTAGGQSGSPIMVANRPACGGPCGMGIHSYGAGGNPPLNSGPRITIANFNTITSQRQQNGN